MKKKSKLVYIIPTYNERENIIKMLQTVTKIIKRLKNYDSTILVVDDNSPDGTGELVKKVRETNKLVNLLGGPKKGLGQAMIRGYKFAMRDLNADLIITNEADFSYSPFEMPLMINLIENGSDVVFGSRKLTNLKRWSTERKIIHWVANTLFANFIAGIKEVDDHNSAFKAIKVKNVLDKISFNGFPKGFAFFNYFTFKLSLVSKNLVEFYTTYTPRAKGSSKISLKPKYLKYFIKDSLEYVLICFKIRLERTFK